VSQPGVAGADAPPQAAAMTMRPGLIAAVLVFAVYGSVAIGVDFPRAAIGIQSDEATYYMMGHSLAADGDLAYRREDLARVWSEFPAGPSGVFLKKGRTVRGVRMSARPPFVVFTTGADPDDHRLFFGKSFAYPLAAFPLVWLFGTNGFLVLNAALLAIAVLCGYLFLHARTRPGVAALLAAGFVMATVVPVYFVWITPELFNFTLVLAAYFAWLFKEVVEPVRAPRGTRWLLGPGSDLAAAVLLGIATFSKPTNVLLYAPIVVWQLWRRRWGRAIAGGVICAAIAAGLFAINMAISGDWNYQGGQRSTFYAAYPFQTPDATFDVGAPRARDEALTDILFDPQVFWINLRNNLRYYFVGRYSGLVAYFFPAVFALLTFAVRPRRPGWQYLVLAGCLGQILFFVLSVPYTYFGGGGSVGNRYFMGAYGAFIFLLPPIGSVGWALAPWIVGSLFSAQLVLNPFVSSFRPGEYADHGPLRLLPVELTNVNDLPINTNPARVRVAFGENPDLHDPPFQIYFLDSNAYQREQDRSFWVRGASRAEFLIKTDRPMRHAALRLESGAVPTDVTVRVGRRSQALHLRPGETQNISIALDAGFPYQGRFVWVASISSSGGFSPVFHGGTDARYLGVRVRPSLVP
jgi:hypothetical protein